MSSERRRARGAEPAPPPSPQELAQQREQQRLERRALLKGALGLGGAAAAAGWLSLAPPTWPLSLRDPDGERGKPKAALRRLPEGGFVVPDAPSVAEADVAGRAGRAGWHRALHSTR
jgi:hypothetical protein